MGAVTGTVVVCSTCGAVMPAGVGGPIAALLWHQAEAHGRGEKPVAPVAQANEYSLALRLHTRWTRAA